MARRERTTEKEAARQGYKIAGRGLITIPMTLAAPLVNGKVCAMTSRLGLRLAAWMHSPWADRAERKGPTLPLETRAEFADLVECLERLRRHYQRIENAHKRAVMPDLRYFTSAVSIRQAASRTLARLAFVTELWWDEDEEPPTKPALIKRKFEALCLKVVRSDIGSEGGPLPLLRIPASCMPIIHALAGPITAFPKNESERTVWQDIAVCDALVKGTKNGPLVSEDALGREKLLELIAYAKVRPSDELTETEYQSWWKLEKRATESLKLVDARLFAPTPAHESNFWYTPPDMNYIQQTLKVTPEMLPVAARCKDKVLKLRTDLHLKWYSDGSARVAVELPIEDRIDYEVITLRPTQLREGLPPAVRAYEGVRQRRKPNRTEAFFDWEKVDV